MRRDDLNPHEIEPANGTAVARFHGPVRAAGDMVAGDKIVLQVPPRVPPPIGQLPMAPDCFAGREAELSAMDAALASAGGRRSASVVAIHGMAGVGKTSLAVQWAYRVADRFPDGQIFQDLRGPSAEHGVEPNRMLFWLLQALGVDSADIPADEAPRVALYRSILAKRRVLIVLDNAASAEQIRPLLPGGPGNLVVVTSRVHLAGLVARFRPISVPG